MFFHPIRNVETKVSKKSAKDIKTNFDKVGLKPIQCASKLLDDFLNDFGWLRNDIQNFLRTSDPVVQRAIADNLSVVSEQGVNKDATIEDVFNQIVPASVQTPAEIERFGRVLAKRFEGMQSLKTKVADLVEKVNADTDKDKTTEIDVDKEL